MIVKTWSVHVDEAIVDKFAKAAWIQDLRRHLCLIQVVFLSSINMDASLPSFSRALVSSNLRWGRIGTGESSRSNFVNLWFAKIATEKLFLSSNQLSSNLSHFLDNYVSRNLAWNSFQKTKIGVISKEKLSSQTEVNNIILFLVSFLLLFASLFRTEYFYNSSIFSTSLAYQPWVSGYQWLLQFS